jgi:phospholipid/cholesterol/gamma-HCH transport system substrate-binding protein
MKRKSIAGPLIKALIFVIVTGLATTVLALTIADTNAGNMAQYKARFTDVSGLNTGDDIRIAGVRIGQVDGVVNKRTAEVTFSIDASRTLPASVTAAIMYRNLLGQRYIALGEGTGAVDATLPVNGTIPMSQTSPPLDLTELFNGFKPLFQAMSPNDVNQLSNELVQVLQGEGGTIDGLLSHVASLTQTLAGKDQAIGQVIDNLNNVLNTVNSRDGALQNMISTLQQLVSGLASDRQPIGNAVSALSSLATSTAGLLQGARPGIQQDIIGLGQVATNLANNTPMVNQFLQNLPNKLNAIGTTASYGSWLNLFLCEATVSGVSAPPGSTAQTGVVSPAGRCH